jgi:hypothetical protein
MPDPDSSVSRSSADALYQLLDELRNTNAATLADAWSKILGASLGSFEFAQRHGEVVRLWNDIVIHIGALARESTRNRMLTYATAWWQALIMPDAQWRGGNYVSASVINPSDLDHLASLSDLISAQLHGTAADPASSDLASLRAQCDEWMLLLAGSDEITDEIFRNTLRTQVGHLLWLIDNANRFGVSRVVEHGDQLTGTLLRTAATPDAKTKVKNLESFKGRIMKLVLALTLIAGTVRSSETVIGAAEHSVPVIEKVVHEITDGRIEHEIRDIGHPN